MKNNKFTTAQLTLLGLMAAILLLMAYTPLGYLNIGPLAISFNVIPVAISAVVLGPVGGAVAGAIFGLTSFLQCIGVGGSSAMGVVLFGINPVFAFIQRFIPRLLDGICLGYIFKGMRKVSNIYVACAVTGFFSAFLNTLFFYPAGPFPPGWRPGQTEQGSPDSPACPYTGQTREPPPAACKRRGAPGEWEEPRTGT